MPTVEVPEPVTEVGLKVAVAPVGNPLALKATLPLKPLSALTVAVYVALLPTATLCGDGPAETEKSATFSVTVAECTRLPDVPVRVTV